MFQTNKGPIKLENKANVINRITCPGCFNKYIKKKIAATLLDQNAQGTKHDQPMYQLLSNCAKFNG